MFGWDLTRLTTNALAEMDCTCGGEEIPWCVCVVGGGESKRKEGKCVHIRYAPAVRAFIHTGSPISVHNASEKVYKCAANHKTNERQ